MATKAEIREKLLESLEMAGVDDAEEIVKDQLDLLGDVMEFDDDGISDLEEDDG